MSVSNRVGCPVAGPEPDTFTDELCSLPLTLPSRLLLSPFPTPLALPAQAYMDKLTVILLYTHIFLSSFSVVTRFFPCTVPVRFVKSLMARRAGIESRTDRGAGGGAEGQRDRLFERESKNSFALAFPLLLPLLLNGRRPCNFYTVVKVLFDMWQVASGQQQKHQWQLYSRHSYLPLHWL